MSIRLTHRHIFRLTSSAMKEDKEQRFERKAFRFAVTAACLLHCLTVAGLVLADSLPREAPVQALAVMEFAPFDPQGGESGSGSGEEKQAKERSAPPVPELEASEPTHNVIGSSSEEAPPSPAPLPVKPKPAPRPKPARTSEKPAPLNKAKTDTANISAPAGTAGAGGGNGASGDGEGRGGFGGGTGQGDADALRVYIGLVRKELERRKVYPDNARARHIQGTVTIRFAIARNGKVTSSSLVRSSGHGLLDRAALSLPGRVSPFPAIPPEVERDSLVLTVPIRFDLK